MLIEIAAAAIGGGFVGYFTCAAMTMSKVADVRADEYESAVHWQSMWKHALDTSIDNADAHTRASDALATQRARIERALAVETPKAAHGVKKMAAILRGEVA